MSWTSSPHPPLLRRYCTCPRCEGLPDAALDDEFLSIRETFTTNAATGRRLAELVAEQHEARVAQGRKLQQLSEETVDKLLVSVNSLRESQSGLTTQVRPITPSPTCARLPRSETI